MASEFSQPQFIPTVSGAGTNFSHHQNLMHSATQEITSSHMAPQTFSDHVPYSGNTPDSRQQTTNRNSNINASNTSKNLKSIKTTQIEPVKSFNYVENSAPRRHEAIDMRNEVNDEQNNVSRSNMSRIEMDEEERK